MKPEKALIDFIHSNNLDNKKVLIALSGGADSVSLLLSSISCLGKELVCACYVNHGIRNSIELLDEEKLITSLCEKNDVVLSKIHIKPGYIESKAKEFGGVESAARYFRYKALEKARKSFHCDIIFTAHNEDDFVETMTMHFFNGSGIAGLRGIPQKNSFIYRPFLNVTKKEIYEYVEQKKTVFSTDSTNISDLYLRNKIRHNVIPTVLSIYPDLYSSLSTVATKNSIDEEALSFYANKLLENCQKNILNAVMFDSSPLAIRIRSLYLISKDLSLDKLPWRFVYNAAVSSKKDGILASGFGIVFKRNNNFIYAKKDIKTDLKLVNYSIFTEKTGIFPIGKESICRIYFCDSVNSIHREAFSWPIIVRNRQIGDYIKCSYGIKYVDDLFKEIGVDVSIRDTIPLVIDKDGIVAILALSYGYRNIYRHNDKIDTKSSFNGLIIEVKGRSSINAV